MTSCEPFPTCKIKARAGDWAVEDKVELKSFGARRRTGEERGQWKRRRWKNNEAEACGLEESQVIRISSRGYSSAVVDLPNLDM